MNDDQLPMDDIVSGIMADLCPRIESAIREAFARGERKSDARYSDKIAQASRLLTELNQINSAPTDMPADNIPTGSVWTGRAGLGTVKPRVLELISRDIGASVQEIEGIGIKPNSVRGTLYALQKDGKIQRRGNRWYGAPLESSGVSDSPETPKSSDPESQALFRESAAHDR